MAERGRPSPARGVFETLLVRNGVPLELDRHLERLSASVQELYGEALPPTARTLIAASAEGIELGRLRLTATPAPARGLELDVVTAPVEPSHVLPGREHAVALRQLVVPGGLGAHKWADRELLNEAESRFAGALALVVDEDGTVLEGSRGNLFAVYGELVATPAADGRILPGVTRRRVVELARESGLDVREQRITLDELPGADEVFLSGAVRGIEPVWSLEGHASWGPGEKTAALSDRLLALWTAEAAGQGAATG